jgi:hypothetical protein
MRGAIARSLRGARFTRVVDAGKDRAPYRRRVSVRLAIARTPQSATRFDLVLSGAVAAVLVAYTWVADAQPGRKGFGTVVALGIGAALFWRRRAPVVVGVTVSGSGALYELVVREAGTVFVVPYLIAFYSLGAYTGGGRWRSVAGFCLAYAATVFGLLADYLGGICCGFRQDSRPDRGSARFPPRCGVDPIDGSSIGRPARPRIATRRIIAAACGSPSDSTSSKPGRIRGREGRSLTYQGSPARRCHLGEREFTPADRAGGLSVRRRHGIALSPHWRSVTDRWQPVAVASKPVGRSAVRTGR